MIRFTGGCRIVPNEVRQVEVDITDSMDPRKNVRLLTEQPNYNVDKRTYSMNMHGCAKQPSVNNLKLKDQASGKSVFLLGKE
jgi:hypothetical protein